ncbi:hypothetical protein V6Z11_A10G074700 [Gossypium hirsutum]
MISIFSSSEICDPEVSKKAQRFLIRVTTRVGRKEVCCRGPDVAG